MQDPAGPAIDARVCPTCGAPLRSDARFCGACGQPLDGTAEAHDGWPDTIRFLWAAGLVIAYILGSYLVEDWMDHTKVIAFDVGFMLLVVMVALWFSASIGRSLVPRRISFTRVLMYLGLQAGLTMVVLVSNPWLTRVFDLQELSYTLPFLDSAHPVLYALLSTAVMPALTEELAFRGILFGQLARLTTVNSTIIVTALLFAFVHFSMLSMYWLFPAGLLYGWIRAREGHIWWGVSLHMGHNALVVMQEIAG